jgi:hypothetical protein
MPLPRWLRSRAPTPTADPSAVPLQSPLDTTPDPNARIHIAAHDPDFPAKREAAVTAICAAIDLVAVPAGYTRTGTTWARQSLRGKTAVHLQRSRYGFDATVILRFLPADGVDLDGTVWAADDDIALSRFYPAAPDPAVIFYLDVHDDVTSLEFPMRILRDRALPWLDAHHAWFPDLNTGLGE